MAEISEERIADWRATAEGAAANPHSGREEEIARALLGTLDALVKAQNTAKSAIAAHGQVASELVESIRALEQTQRERDEARAKADCTITAAHVVGELRKMVAELAGTSGDLDSRAQFTVQGLLGSVRVLLDSLRLFDHTEAQRAALTAARAEIAALREVLKAAEASVRLKGWEALANELLAALAAAGKPKED